uniref:Transposase Tc1-like domain-containing protein n=1 Tax=Caenorhabditis japonica TaxID=281687 RepID=A0A8R1ERC7_CAEJA
MISRWKHQGQLIQRKYPGRSRQTSKVIGNISRAPSTDIQACVISAAEPTLSRRTIRRRLNQNGSFGKHRQYQCPTVKHGGGNVMVWGYFADGHLGPLRSIVGIIDRF